jgi:hypothetical protein
VNGAAMPVLPAKQLEAFEPALFEGGVALLECPQQIGQEPGPIDRGDLSADHRCSGDVFLFRWPQDRA